MNEGWIKLHRKFLEWEWFELSEMVKLFVYFLLKANHKSNNWKGIKVERGQLITGRKKLSKELRMSEQRVRTCIERLKSTNEITMQSTNKYSIITVCNYDNYNTVDNKKQPTKQPVSNQETTSKQPANNQQLTTNKNDKNVNNVKNVIKKRISFYSDQIKNIEEKEGLKDRYVAFVSYMFGKNAIGSPAEHILKLEKQLTFDEYKKLFSASNSKNMTVGELMDSWVNNPKYSKNKVSIYLTLNNWINRSDGKNIKLSTDKKWTDIPKTGETLSLLEVINKMSKKS